MLLIQQNKHLQVNILRQSKYLPFFLLTFHGCQYKKDRLEHSAFTLLAQTQITVAKIYINHWLRLRAYFWLQKRSSVYKTPNVKQFHCSNRRQCIPALLSFVPIQPTFTLVHRNHTQNSTNVKQNMYVHNITTIMLRLFTCKDRSKLCSYLRNGQKVLTQRNHAPWYQHPHDHGL